MILRSLPAIPCLFLCAAGAAAQTGTAFTYQGRLSENGQPANGAYDLSFRLYSSAGAVIAIGDPWVVENVSVADGLFTVSVDFGSGGFPGQDRWMAIGVRPGAQTGGFTALAPRQRIMPAPYALSAGSLSLPVHDVGDTDPSAFLPNPLLHIVQTGTAAAVIGQAAGPGAGVQGVQSGTGAGVHAKSTNPAGAALHVEGGAIRVSPGAGVTPLLTIAALPPAMNTLSSVITIDHPLLNDDPMAVLIVTPQQGVNIFNQQPIAPVGAYTAYDSATGRWTLRPLGGTLFPLMSMYHVLVIKR